ncbi:MAG: PQQ-binding-like beta-propeller repeat protein [Planctomycetes bacterium]|jgi:hypothetical protein|nr:PQQ-binding-like beta-propeller repeat protein [Planctomycetota bacterium]
MNHYRSLLIVTTCLFLSAGVFIVSLHAQDDGASGVNHQKMLDRDPWVWNEDYASLLFCISQAGDTYDIHIRSPHDQRSKLHFSVHREGKTVYEWVGHRYTVFRILGDRLYYPRFHFSSSGGEVVAVDLKTGEEMWRTPLQALGPIEHSAYLNRIIVNASDETVLIQGNESLGRYVEIKNAETGNTIAHRIYDDDRVEKVTQ